MTLLPADAQSIEPLRGPEWPTYKVPTICALDGCSSLNVERHHLVRRSWTVGPYDWVKIGDRVVGNIMPLCYRHHRKITDNEARIVWEPESATFFWQEEGTTLNLSQPPSVVPVALEGHVHEGRDEAMSCPSCGQRIRPKIERNGREEKRARKTWSITVPADSREFGADVLDTLLESARLILDEHGLSYGEDRGVRYFILSTALGIFVAQAEDILSEGAVRS